MYVLTRKTRFRADKNGKLILQVQEKYEAFGDFTPSSYRWRDANISDITEGCIDDAVRI